MLGTGYEVVALRIIRTSIIGSELEMSHKGNFPDSELWP